MKDTLHDDMNELENTASVHEHEDDCDCGCCEHEHDHEEHEHHHEHEEHEHHHHHHEHHHHHHHDDDHCDCDCCDDDDDDCDCGCHDHDHHHHHEEVHHVERVHTGNSKIYILQNLGCAHCAAKMEEKINNLPGVTAATITYTTKQLRLSAKDPDNFLPEVQKICASIESEVKVVARDELEKRKNRLLPKVIPMRKKTMTKKNLAALFQVRFFLPSVLF